jgi:hypothetical protein
MRKRHWTFLLAATMLVFAGVVVACGDDDSNPDQPKDGGTDSPMGNPDTGPLPDTGAPDGGSDSGCTFATYVIYLINNKTNAQAKPDTTLGAQCADTTSQADFKSLFP